MNIYVYIGKIQLQLGGRHEKEVASHQVVKQDRQLYTEIGGAIFATSQKDAVSHRKASSENCSSCPS